MTDLEDRLHVLRGATVSDDWPDVVARGERHRRRTLVRRVLVGVAVAVLAVPAIAIATGYWDVFSLSATEEEVPLPEGENTLGYVFGDQLHLPGRPPARLSAPLLAPFVYPETGLVVPSPDGRKVVYHAWEGGWPPRRRAWQGTPLLRLFDSESGRDVVLARGAHSIAWRSDGVLAYTRALVPVWSPRRQGGGFFGHVVVRRSPRKAPVRWSTFASRWSSPVWAGRHLIAQAHVNKPFELGGFYVSDQLWAFSGPLRGRRLPLKSLVAVSPDGRFVLGRTSTLGDRGGEDLLRLVEVATGRIVGTLRRSGAPGAWAGDTIIMPTGIAPAPLEPGPRGIKLLPFSDHVEVVVLRYADGKLAFDREVKLTRDVIQATGLRADEFYFGFRPPAFVDKAGRQFTTELVIENIVRNRQIQPKRVYLTCDLVEIRCRRGHSLEPLWRSAALVSNPSRPRRD
jgi:hypothetical protein